MNIVGRFFGFGASLQNSDSTELVKIPSGQLYFVRPGNIRSSHECIYNDAMATVRKVSSVEYNFQLVITRVFEEGEEDILEEEDENDEKVFLIGTELEFRTGELDGEPTLIWRDLDGDVDETYEFVATGANTNTIERFAQTMYRAMYERKYRTNADRVTRNDLQEFVWKGPDKKRNKARKPSKTGSRVDNELSSALNKLTVAATPVPEPQPEPEPEPEPKVEEPPKADYMSLLTSLPTLITKNAELYLWDKDDGHFLKQDDVRASITQTSKDYDFVLLANTHEGQQLIAHKITSNLNSRWSSKLNSLTWNHSSESGLISSWCFKFENEEDYKAFQEEFSACMYETLNNISWKKAKADEQQYIMSSYENDVEMKDVEDEDEDDEDDEGLVEDVLGRGGESESESEGSDKGDDDEDEDEDEDEELNLPKDGEQNSQLTVGYKNGRTFVARGDKIGVFKHTDEGKLDYAATISGLGFKKMKSFKPKHMMLHEQDAKMILMNPLEQHSLFAMDIEYGKIVEEWKVDDNITVDHIAPKSKFAQTTGEQTLVGTSHNSIFRIDPRLGGRGGNTMTESKQYTTKNAFSGVTTTGSGQLAVASDKGDIRLYDTVGKIAKTALPAMGDPILGVDVTANGRWLVATCKTYLLVIDTLIGNGRYAGSLGFDRAFPADSRPQPKRLQLRAEHAVYMGHDVSFSPARFNQGEGVEENAIVTSSGRYVVAWDFAKVKKGRLDSYVIKQYEENVVQDNFRFGDDKEIVVALQNNVIALNKKSLKKLPQGTLSTPTNQLSSRSGIVNSPY